jgi:phage/plasmid-like protein (TIGR03299 family)
VVCQNTLGFAFEDLKKQQRRHIKVDHMKKFDPTPIKEQLGLLDKAWTRFMEQINPMANYPLQNVAAQLFFESLFLSDKELEEGKPIANAKHKEINQIASLFRSAPGQDLATSKGTLWGAVNAVTHYVDHVRSTRSVERIDSAWFGTGALLKEKAWQRAMKIVEVANASTSKARILA